MDAAHLKDRPSSKHIPYIGHVANDVVNAKNDTLLTVIRLDGFSHESADYESLAMFQEQLNVMLRNIASPHVAVWSHLVRSRDSVDLDDTFQPGFSRDLHNSYIDKLHNSNLLKNRLYLTLVYRPPARNRSLFNVFEKREDRIARYKDNIEKLRDVTGLALSGLRRYKPRVLSTYKRNEASFSEPLEFFAYLINGFWQRIPVPQGAADRAISISRPLFGKEVFEQRGVAESKLGATLGIKEYPSRTSQGFTNVLLSAPFELILTQSFTFVPKADALKAMETAQNRMENTEDPAQSQIAAITEARDDVASNRIVMGHQHFSLSVFAARGKQLKENLNEAANSLSELGMVVSREDLALEAAFWAQLPAQFRMRPRPTMISSRNFAGFSSFHNYPGGRREGNQWGPALTAFLSAAGAPFYFNFHDGRPHKDKIGMSPAEAAHGVGEDDRKDLGNTYIFGPPGSGKTVLQCFLLSEAQKYKPSAILIDKDNGMELAVRAMGGRYQSLKSGQPTGFNPFRGLSDSPDDMLFLQDLVKKLCTINGEKLTVQQHREIEDGVNHVMRLDHDSRRLSRIISYLDTTDEEGPAARLGAWCEGGAYGWVFDNEHDELDLDLSAHSVIYGFDVTDFLENPLLRTPIIMYIDHRTEKLLDGRPLLYYIDEAAKTLQDEYFKAGADNKSRVFRKQNGVIVFGSQSETDPVDVGLHNVFRSTIGTQIFFGNHKASVDSLKNDYNLSDREIEIIREELPDSRRFLVKRSTESIVCELDLSGFDDELAILSGTTGSIELSRRIRDQVGNDPADWLPEFQRQRRRGVNAA